LQGTKRYSSFYQIDPFYEKGSVFYRTFFIVLRYLL